MDNERKENAPESFARQDRGAEHSGYIPTGKIIPISDVKVKAKTKDEQQSQPSSIDLTTITPKALDFVFPGLLTGTCGVLSAPGGSGKSFFLLQLGLAVATGTPLIPGICPETPGPVAYLGFEDPEVIISNRLCAIFSAFPGVREEAADTFFASSFAGRGFLLTNRQEIDSQSVDTLIQIATNCRLVIVDPLRNIHTLEENDSGQMMIVANIFQKICKETGTSILISHHSSKASLWNNYGNSQASARGSSAIIDAARLGLTLSPPFEKELKSRGISEDKRSWFVNVHFAKTNYCAPQEPILLQRQANGVLLEAEEEIIAP